jgi:dGTP triphosphohydrolase
LPDYFAEEARRQMPARVVCDYIAGMTDNFLLLQHEQIRKIGGTRQVAVL